MAPIVVAEKVSRSFPVGDEVVHALREATVAIEPGTLVLLQGPSGSGKTTLINLLGALDVPSSGTVHFEGHALHEMAEPDRDDLRRRRMGFVFQSVGLITLMSAFENVEFGLRIAGTPAEDRARRTEECLALVGLARRMDHRPTELSGGEQQRVAIARAMAHRPAVIFADEPTAELDTAMGLRVIESFRSLVTTEGVTVIMSSHDPAVAEIVDRVVQMEDGRITNAG
jgi:putative ABC transport system ATP-binding protein